MGASFQIVRLTSWIDGAEVSRCDGARLHDGQPVEVWTGSLPAGDHNLLVLAEYNGDGHQLFS
jgi:hypothetical protein